MLRYPAVAARRASTSCFPAVSRRAGLPDALASACVSVRYLHAAPSSMRVSNVKSWLYASAARLLTAAMSETCVTVWMKREGDTDFILLHTKAKFIAELLKEGMENFPNLQDNYLCSYDLFFIDKDGHVKPGQSPLKKTDTVEAALLRAPQSGGEYFFLIKEAPPVETGCKYASGLPLDSPRHNALGHTPRVSLTSVFIPSPCSVFRSHNQDQRADRSQRRGRLGFPLGSQ